MSSIFNSLFRRKNKPVQPKKLNSATAKKVLQFLSHGLTCGAQSLASHYRPQSKVNEFVAVSGSILQGLKQHAGNTSDAVEISMHINGMEKKIRFIQVGDHVMLTLDGCESLISLTTLEQLCCSLRDDILKHEDIYGASLHKAVSSDAGLK